MGSSPAVGDDVVVTSSEAWLTVGAVRGVEKAPVDCDWRASYRACSFAGRRGGAGEEANGGRAGDECESELADRVVSVVSRLWLIREW